MFSCHGSVCLGRDAKQSVILTVTWKLLSQFGETTKVINAKSAHCDAHFGSKVTQTSLIFKKIGSFIQNAHLKMLLRSNNDLSVMDSDIFCMGYEEKTNIVIYIMTVKYNYD